MGDEGEDVCGSGEDDQEECGPFYDFFFGYCELESLEDYMLEGI